MFPGFGGAAGRALGAGSCMAGRAGRCAGTSRSREARRRNRAARREEDPVPGGFALLLGCGEERGLVFGLVFGLVCVRRGVFSTEHP